MVFALAVLLAQFNPVPKVVEPLFAANLIPTVTAPDGTRPKPVTATALVATIKTIEKILCKLWMTMKHRATTP